MESANLKSDKNHNRILYLDALRILASINVILLHTSAQNWAIVPVSSWQWITFNFYDSISRWCVPVFVMISGTLLLEKEITIKEIHRHNLLRIITAFIFWSAFYAVVFLLKGETLKSAFAHFISGEYHMWFLFMIAGLYLIIPFLKQIIKSKKLVHYFLILSLIFALCIPQGLSLLTYKLGETNTIIKLINGIINNTNLKFVLGYTGYFIFGYYLNHTEISKRKRIIIYMFSIIGFAMTILFSYVASIKTGKAVGSFYGNMTINVFLESLGVFVFIKSIFNNRTISDKLKKVLVLTSNYSFGVYLVHVFILTMFSRWNLNSLTFNPILSVPIICILVFFISLGISIMLNKIPLLNKYIV